MSDLPNERACLGLDLSGVTLRIAGLSEAMELRLRDEWSAFVTGPPTSPWLDIEIEFAEQAYALGLDDGYEFVTDTLRFTYESPSTPEQTYDFDMRTRERTLRKTQEIPSGHDSELYLVERFSVSTTDGAEIPVTVLRLRTTPVDGTAPPRMCAIA